MSEKKIQEIENMFKQAQKPKLIIEDREELKQIVVILDETEQGKNALYLALQLAERDKHIKVKVILSEDFHESFDPLIKETIRILSRLDEMADTQAHAKNVKIAKETLVEQKIQKLIEQYTSIPEEDSLSKSLIKKLIEINPDIIVLGIPLFREVRTDQSIDIGTYAASILRKNEIHGSFLLISDKLNNFNDTLLSFVSIEQQAGSIAAVTRRGLSLASKDTRIKIIGVVENKVIETVARVDLAAEEQKMEEEQAHKTEQKTEDEAEQKTEDEAEQKTEDDAEQKTEDETEQKTEDETEQKTEDEAKQKTEDEAEQKTEDEVKQKTEDEAEQKTEDEAEQKTEDNDGNGKSVADKEEEKEEASVDFNAATAKLVSQLDSTMKLLKISEDIPHKSYDYEIKTGTLAAIVKDTVLEVKPGIVLVRSVAVPSEHLDAFALQVTQQILNIGYPVLIVWD